MAGQKIREVACASCSIKCDAYNKNKIPLFTSTHASKAIYAFERTGMPSALSKYCNNYDLSKLTNAVVVAESNSFERDLE